LAGLIETLRYVGFVDIVTGIPVDVLAGAKGEPPARQFEPFGVAVAARKL
jgi:hypothetical protein